MNLEAYLAESISSADKKTSHTKFVDFISKNLSIFGIKRPYIWFSEVGIFERTIKNIGSDKKEEKKTLTCSDLVVLNSGLYVFEAKIICPNNKDMQKKEKDKIRRIKNQLSLAYGFFNRNFDIKPILIGAYKIENSPDFYYYFQDADGSTPKDSEILKVSCQ
jgi:hypothetical protein